MTWIAITICGINKLRQISREPIDSKQVWFRFFIQSMRASGGYRKSLACGARYGHSPQPNSAASAPAFKAGTIQSGGAGLAASVNFWSAPLLRSPVSFF
jgi:hypothetical protein